MRAGFTFVELMIASTMLSVLFVGLGAHLRGGMVVWQRVTTTTDRLNRQHLVLDRIEQDLANSIIYDARLGSYGDELGQLPPLEFTQSTLAWWTVVPASRSQPATVRFVTYRCGLDGRSQEPAVLRTSQSVGEARARVLSTSQRLFAGCDTLSFRYAYQDAPGTPLEWQPTWPAHEPVQTLTLPHLVEVTVERSAGGRFARLCAIPIGVLGQQTPSP